MIPHDTHQHKCTYGKVEYILEQVYVSELGFVMYRLFDPKRKIWMNVNTGHFTKTKGFGLESNSEQLLQKMMESSHDIPAEFNHIISENFFDLT
jgi:hypothetical protein